MAGSLRGSGAAVKVASGDLNVPVYASTASGDVMVCEVVAGDNVPLGFPDGAAEFRAAGAKSAGLAVATAIAAPAGVATGDLEVMVASTIAGGTLSITTAGGSAWTLLGDQDVASGERLYAWWRIRQAGDSNPSITPSSDHVVGVRLAYKAGTFDTTTPIDNWTVGSETTSDTSYSFAPGFSTSVDNCLVLSVSTSGVDSNTAQVPVCTNANLAQLASRANYETTNGGGGGFGITEGYLATAGAVGTFACTYAGASPKAYASFAIRPDPAATAWQILDETNNGTGIRLTTAWKRAGSSEGTFTVTHTGGNGAVARCHSFQGCKATGSPFGVRGTVSSNSGTGTTGTATATGITPTYTNSGIIFVSGFSSGGTSGGGANNFASWTGTDPTFTEIGDDNSSVGAREAGAGAAYGTSSGAATGNRSVSLSVMDGTGGWVALSQLIELLDASPTGGGGSSVTIAAAIAGAGSVSTPVKEDKKVVAAVAGLGAVAAPVKDTRTIAVPIAGVAAVSPSTTKLPKGIIVTVAGQAAITAAVKETKPIVVPIAGLGVIVVADKKTEPIIVPITAGAAVAPAMNVAGSATQIAAAIAGLAVVASALKNNRRAAATVAGTSTVTDKITSLERINATIAALAVLQPGLTVDTPGGTLLRLRILMGAGE